MIGFLVLYLWGQNVVFNPGFDMTPWDTGWTIETDTVTSGTCPSRVAQAQADTDIGSSLPNCCHLKTSVGLSSSSYYCAGSASAETKVYQIFDEIPSCSVKAQIKYFWTWNAFMCEWIDTATVDVKIGETWQTVWGKAPHSPWDTSWSKLSIGVNDTITGIMFRVKTLINCSSIYSASLSFYFWIDDINIGEVDIEERDFSIVKNLDVVPNPFLRYTKVKNVKQGTGIEIYDIMGKLVKKTYENIVGENLPAGIYFVKIKGYEPVRVTKIGGAR